MEELKAGITNTAETTVTKEMLASAVGSGTLNVYATPMVAALIEKAASELAAPYLSSGITTVGTNINIDHLSATPCGSHVYATVTLTATDGRKFEFDAKAYDEAGLIAQGKHTRFTVQSEKFMAKAQSKLGEKDEV